MLIGLGIILFIFVMMMNKVLITDAVHPVLIEGMQAKAYEVTYMPDISYEETKKIIHDYQGLIINSKILCTRPFIDLATNLRFIGRLGSGREVVDIQYAESKGIKVCFSPEGNKNAVAEHALGMLLSLANQLHVADAEVKQKIWKREARRGWEMAGKTVGIIGFGHTGSQFAKKLRGMEVNVLAFDKYLGAGYADEFDYVTEVSLNKLQLEAQIISFHLPLAQDTYHFADRVFFENCNPGTIIMNTSRGNVIDTGALIQSLENNHIGGACLDVFQNEKPETFTEEEKNLYERLYRLKNVILSPHIAGWTIESKYLLSKVLLNKLFP